MRRPAGKQRPREGEGMDGSFSAMILAGGLSTRMGRSKAELDFGGQRLIAHQAEKLRALGITDIVIAGYPEPVPGTRYAPDRYPHCGPMSGIHAGLAAIQNDAALVLAVDTPLVPDALLLALLRRHEAGATVVTLFGEPEPLIGVYDRAMAELCEQALRQGKASVRRFLKETGYTPLPYEGDPFLLSNCNTPAEYRAVCAYRNMN